MTCLCYVLTSVLTELVVEVAANTGEGQSLCKDLPLSYSGSCYEEAPLGGDSG